MPAKRPSRPEGDKEVVIIGDTQDEIREISRQLDELEIAARAMIDRPEMVERVGQVLEDLAREDKEIAGKARPVIDDFMADIDVGRTDKASMELRTRFEELQQEITKRK